MAGTRQFNEQAMLATALDLFWRQGFAGTSMPEIATVTGVQRGSLYNAYGGKEAIFLRAFDLYAERFLASARAALAGNDAETVLGGFLDAAIANMTAGAPPRGCLTTKTATDGSITASARIREKVTALLAALTALLREALEQPSVRARLAIGPERAAELVVTFTRGLAVMERVHGDPARLKAMSDALIATLLRDG